jgi:hypothetical protein
MVSKEAWREQQINVSTHPDRGCALPPSTLAFLSDIFQHLHRVTGRLVTLNVMGLFLVGTAISLDLASDSASSTATFGSLAKLSLV